PALSMAGRSVSYFSNPCAGGDRPTSLCSWVRSQVWSLIQLQHPLQMLLIFLSTIESCELSARIVSSPGIVGPEVTVPSMRPPTAPPAGLPAVPTVVEPIGALPAVDVA